jgi:hypothetical protein
LQRQAERSLDAARDVFLLAALQATRLWLAFPRGVLLAHESAELVPRELAPDALRRSAHEAPHVHPRQREQAA